MNQRPAVHDLTVYEIIQLLPSVNGWWLRYNQEGKSYYEKPLCLALIECRWQGNQNRYVGGVDATGQVADEATNYRGLVFSNLNLGDFEPGMAEQ